MPSASANNQLPSKEGPIDSLSPLNQAKCIMEHKMRNLEKRRVKLEGYMEEMEQGKELNEDQKTAIARYDGVVQTLDLTKELHKQFTQIMNEASKNLKKQAKQVEHEKTRLEYERMQDSLIIQDVLNNMGAEDIRSDFLEGKNGAPTLTEEQLKHLDEIYKLISTSQDDVDESKKKAYRVQLASATRHYISLLQGRSKQVLNTNYKDIRAVIMAIHESGYFDKHPEEDKDKLIEDSNHSEATDVNGDEGISDRLEEEELIVNEEEPIVLSTDAGPAPCDPADDLMTCPPTDQEPSHPSNLPVESSYFNFTPYTQPQPRPITEVIGSGGSFNFLQESQIDMESPHMDPAVVVAHPMAMPTALAYPSQADPTLASHYTRAGPVEDSTTAAMTTPQPNIASSHYPNPPCRSKPQPQMHNTSQHPEPTTDFSQPIQSQTFINQNFATGQSIPPTPAFNSRPGYPNQLEQTGPFKSRPVYPSQPGPFVDNVATTVSTGVVSNSADMGTSKPEPLQSQPDPHYMTTPAATYDPASYKQGVTTAATYDPASYKQGAPTAATFKQVGVVENTSTVPTAAPTNFQLDPLAQETDHDFQDRDDSNASGGYAFQHQRGSGGFRTSAPSSRGGGRGGPRGGGRGGTSSTNGFGASRSAPSEKPAFGSGRGERGGSNNYGNFREGSNYYQQGQGTRDGFQREGGQGNRDGFQREGGQGNRDGFQREGGQGNRDGFQREGGFGSSSSYNNGFKRGGDARGGPRGGSSRGGPRGGGPSSGQRPPRKEGFVKPVPSQS